MVQIGDMEGVGSKLKEKLVLYDYNTVQQVAKAEVEDLVKIDGIGAAKAETLIERARNFVEEIAAKRRETELAQQEAEDAEEDVDEDLLEDEDADDSNEEITEEESPEEKTGE